MTVLKTRVIGSNLEKKGFVKAEDSDHIWYTFYAKGNDTCIMTKISHGEREIGDPLIAKMARQLHISKADFVDLVSCNIDGEQYLSMVDVYIDS